MFDEDGERPLSAGVQEAVIMRAGAELEKSCDEQQSHAEPREWFESLLNSGEKAKLVDQFQGPGGGGQDEEVDRGEASDPCDGCQHVKPVEDRQYPR